jgi:hypothetical protein
MRSVFPRIFLRLALLALPASSLLPLCAYAVPSVSPQIKDKEIRVGLLGNYYFNPASQTLADSGTGDLGLSVGVRGVGEHKDFHFAVEGESLYGLRHSNIRYLDIGELYAGWEPSANWNAYVGRKRYTWSELDSYWTMGLFQPRFRWDYLNERESGLFGAFSTYQQPGFSVTAFGSPIMIPEQGAPFNIAGGNCSSSSPWFNCPASTILLFNQPTNVNFQLDIPPVRKIIYHPGAGATARLGQETGPYIRTSYLHAPMNQLLLSFEGRLDLTNTSIPAIIRPRVLYHDLYSIDAGWRNDRNSLTASGIYEHPIRDYTPPSWNTQETVNAKLLGLTARTMPFETNFRNTRFEFGYLHRDGGNAPDQGPFVGNGVNIFEPRFAFYNAFSFAVFTPIVDAWAQDFLVSVKFIVDTANDGNILINNIYYSPLASVFLNMGMDVLGSNNPSPVDFISRYQRNSRLRGGVAYVF